METTILLIALSFLLLWVGSGIAVRSIMAISHSLKMSSFFISFFVLGLFTSITEIIVGFTALIEKRPDIYLGNLLGSSVVVYLLVIPLLAVFGNGITITRSFDLKHVLVISLVAVAPSLLTQDNRFSLIDSMACIGIYAYAVLLVNKKGCLLEKIFHKSVGKKTLYLAVLKIVFAVLMVLVGSHVLVQQIPNLGQMLGVSPFIISIILVSLGTNIPEITIAARSILSKHKEIALGNYFGSAALNTLEVGFLTLLGGRTIPADGSNYSVAAFVVGLFLFNLLFRSGKEISKKEGFVLLFIYSMFVLFELGTGPGWVFVNHRFSAFFVTNTTHLPTFP